MNKTTTTTNEYFVFSKQGYDRMYYGVAGREINFKDSILFLTQKEAEHHADNLNSNFKNQTRVTPNT
jgi:hypothetical protein